MTLLTLYGKPDCHLCEDAEHLLERLRRIHPHHLNKIDINSLPPADFERLRYRIPVLIIGNHELQAPLKPAEVEALLQEVCAE